MQLCKKILKRFDTYASNKPKIYIIPTKIGFIYVGIMFTIFLIGLSYGNNLTLTVAFILFTYFIIQMLVTHKNLGLIETKSLTIYDNHADKDIQFQIDLNSPIPHDNYSLTLREFECKLVLNDFSLQGHGLLARNMYEGEKIKISNTGQSGLFYAWKYYLNPYKFFVYPKIIVITNKQKYETTEAEFSFLENEFLYHSSYVQGQRSSRIDWKVFARSDQLHIKKYSGDINKNVKLDYSNLTGSAEERLSKLAYLLHQTSNMGLSWSLILPNKIINNCNGFLDYKKSIEALAEFQID